MLVILLGTGCKGETRTPDMGGPSGPKESATATAAATEKTEECNARPPQTGAGCDMEGIKAAVQAEISADRGVGMCYRTHETRRSTGRVLVRIVLAPDGAAASVDIAEDDLENPGLAGCLSDLLLTLRYPPPGDVPCTALYPFNFR